VDFYATALKKRWEISSTCVIAAGFAAMFAIANTSLDGIRGMLNTGPNWKLCAVFGISVCIFIPVSSGLYWLFVLHRLVRRLSHLNSHLVIINPINPMATPGLDRLWGVLVWTYMSFILLILVAGILWSVPPDLLAKGILPEACMGPLTWQGLDPVFVPLTWEWLDSNVPLTWQRMASAFVPLTRQGLDPAYRCIVPAVLWIVICVIAIEYALSYLGIQRIVVIQQAREVTKLYNKLRAGQAEDYEKELFGLITKRASSNTAYNMLKAALAVLIPAATVTLQWGKILETIMAWLK
jgi:hypothetical protein